MKKIIFSLVMLFIFNSCRLSEFNSKGLRIVNNSNDTIAFFEDGRTYNSDNPTMFDMLPEERIYFHYVPIRPHGLYNDEIMFPDYYFHNYPDKKAKFYLFSMDTLNKYSYKEIKDGNRFLIRYDLSYEDLDSMNWTITYP
ncbi:MAG: hypothetical protein IKZ89_04560 [Bacteroidaceae bacterium]|nr:hypothetical protein [Bacteroidaceae bacterium]